MTLFNEGYSIDEPIFLEDLKQFDHGGCPSKSLDNKLNQNSLICCEIYLQLEQLLFDSDSEYDSDEGSDDSLFDFADIDINHVLGRSIAVWTYTKPDSITLFTPAPDDTLYRVVHYAEEKLGFDRRDEKVMVLSPGEKTPHEINNIYIVRPGSVVMVIRKNNIHLKVEVNQLKAKFSMSADPLATVHDVKVYIKRAKGIPIDQQDLLFRDKSLENARRLFEYRIHDGVIMHVLIQVRFDFLVNIETFWGKTYRLYVDRCSTGSDLIYTIFGRTFSKYGPDQVLMQELYVPVQVLILQHEKQSIHWDFCLGYFGVKNGDTIELSTVGRKSQMSIQSLKIVSESGESFDIEVSAYDKWSVAAFILHGYTGVPVDLIRLYVDNVQVNYTSVIGDVNKRSNIVMNVLVTNIDADLTYGIPVRIGLGHGILENLKVSPVRKIKDLKHRLEGMGVPNATMYELVIGNSRLPNHAKLCDVIYDLNIPLILKVEKFPVFIHGTDCVIYKTMVDTTDTFKDLKRKIEMKTGHAISNCRILISGQEYKPPEETNLYENGFTTKTSVFVETSNFKETFFITRGHLLIKLRIPIKPKAEDIKKCIWDSGDIPEGSITCLQTFLFWFFSPRVTKKYVLPQKKKSRKLLPAVHQSLHKIPEHNPIKHRTVKPEHKTTFETEDDWFAAGATAAKTLDRSLSLKAPDVVRNKTLDRNLSLKVPKQGGKKIPDSETRNLPDGQRSPEWPLTQRGVQSWIDQGQVESKRSSPRTFEKPQQQRLAKMADPRALKKGKKVRESQHLTPRWWRNLYQRNDENRLLMGNETTVVGQIPQNFQLNPAQRTGELSLNLSQRTGDVSTLTGAHSKTQIPNDVTVTKYFPRKVYQKPHKLIEDTDNMEKEKLKEERESPEYDTYRTNKQLRKHRQIFHKQAIPW